MERKMTPTAENHKIFSTQQDVSRVKNFNKFM